ncbi:MAG: FHA domain-containing protein, partial [Anaerolineae bacterium]
TAPPSPTATATPTAPPSPAATATPSASPTPTRALGGMMKVLPWVAGGCGVVLLLLLVLLAAVFLRRRRPRRPPPSPIPTRPMPPRLEARAAGRPFSFVLQKASVTIGRAPDNDLVVSPDFPGWETVSRHHARIYRQGDRWIVEDLRSTNGIYVNGRRTGRNLLRDGWRLEIGRVAFVFHAGTGGDA